MNGVHMNQAGNLVMARGVLRAFGLDDPQLAKAEAAWKAAPDLVPVAASAGISLEENEQLLSLSGGNTDTYLNERFAKFLKAELEAARNAAEAGRWGDSFKWNRSRKVA